MANNNVAVFPGTRKAVRDVVRRHARDITAALRLPRGLDDEVAERLCQSVMAHLEDPRYLPMPLEQFEGLAALAADLALTKMVHQLDILRLTGRLP